MTQRIAYAEHTWPELGELARRDDVEVAHRTRTPGRDRHDSREERAGARW